MCNQNDSNYVECNRMRQFLNRESTGGLACAELVTYPISENRLAHYLESDSEFNGLYYDSMITISDCHRNITLDFSASEQTDIDNGREKINKLIDMLCELRELNEIQYKRMEATFAEKKQMNKED